MIARLLRHLQRNRPISLTLRNDGLVVCIGWQAGWLSGEVRLIPEDARKVAGVLALLADEADATLAEAIR